MSRLVVLAGPTAVGKGTLLRAVVDRDPNVWVSVSATTRSARPGERNGHDYHFVSDTEFDDLVSSDGLLEWATVHGKHRYGTPRGPVEQALAAGKPAVLEIDLDGVRQVKKTMPDALFVFVMPPSWDELVTRLEGRGTEDASERERRLATAREELAAVDEFDVTVVNDDLDTAVEELERIIAGAR
ncbi:guanylate kinase [Demequina sp. B12]|uniref:guanylate kinase n=1 Tax=Demequina sp. B12 TaxID=2992757 RepID=UPI00237B6733|nr:guanylate kinase [Demequina sp. B12]MDE0573061.1 guanylate kinase [Demequina sp. B12]